MSVIKYDIEVWACPSYLSKIAKFSKRAWRYRYTSKDLLICDLILTRDKQGKKSQISTHFLNDLLPSKRTNQSLLQCDHDYILPRIRTERFKRCLVNRSLFNVV